MSEKPEGVSSEYIPNDTETYDQWFQRQVEIGLKEADDPNTVWVSQEEIFRDLGIRRKLWRIKAERHRDVA